jgi:hypothetical protein
MEQYSLYASKLSALLSLQVGVTTTEFASAMRVILGFE